VHEAVQTLMARGLASSELECEHLWARLPRRPRRQRVEEEQLAGLPGTGRASDTVEEAERSAQERVLVEALERVILALPAGDQIVLRLRFWSGFKISRIAELIGEDPKALYRRFDRACVELKLRLEAEGIRVEDVAGLLGTFTEPDRGGPGA